MKAIILDPIGGASGDMILASLIHLGCPIDYLNETLARLGIAEASSAQIISAKELKDNGISSITINFNLTQESIHERSYAEIKKLISETDLTQAIRDRALDIFDVIARAEAAVHGSSIDHVHFHEVGAVDSILDIVGIATAIEWFNVDACFYRTIPLGSGTTTCRHGTIPVPVPATMKIIEGMKARFTDIKAELVTPTGAAVLKALSKSSAPPSDIIIKASGCGAGTRRIEGWPNLFRAILCDLPHPDETLYIVEADVDDMDPEDWEYATEQLYSAGALDVSLAAQTMKRGRPGTSIKVITTDALLSNITETMLTCTTTIGVRFFPVSRQVLERREYTAETSLGKVNVKESVLPDGTRRRKPEYRDLSRIAKEKGLSLEKVRKTVLSEIESS